MDCIFWNSSCRNVFYAKEIRCYGIMLNKLKIKKGELTTQQLVALIILIVSFGVILFLIFRLNLGELTDKEICHNSVAMVGRGEGFVGKLDCKTSYVCISGGGKCGDFNPGVIKEIDLDKKDENGNSLAKDEVLKAIAEEMADCWWMFGEGKVNYVGKDIKGTHCAICSVVKFDNVIQESLIYEDLFSYLEKAKKDNSQTYLQYLFGISKSKEFADKSNYLSTNYKTPFSLSEKYVIITGRNENLDLSPLMENKDEVLPVYFIKSEDLKKTPCEIYDITKA